MATPTLTMRPASQCLRRVARTHRQLLSSPYHRTLTATADLNADASIQKQKPPPIDPSTLDPNLVSTKREERLLLHHKHVHPIGSRRRRALATQYPNSLPFEQMPYQCFQEARKVLAEDREEKLAQIAEMRARIVKASNVPASRMGGEYVKKGKLVRMQKWLEELKVLADANDPVIKKRFEDGMGDMNRPIYRHLARQKWHSYKRPLMMQRISQFHIVPDILPHLDPTAEVSLGFGRRNVQPGELIDSRVSEIPARLKVQVFDKGERLVSVVVMDPDVPDEAKDSFGTRCHFLAVNIPVSPANPSMPLSKLKKDEHVVLPWLPPFAQKGAPYHRLAIFVLQQQEGQVLELEELKKGKVAKRKGWKLQSFTEPRKLMPVGVNIFRTIWDEGADGVAKRAGYEDAGVEFVRKKPEKLPYKKKDGARYR